MKLRVLSVIGVLSLAIIACMGTANAQTGVSILNGCFAVTGFTDGCSGGPYGTVTLTPSGSNVDVSLTLDPGFYFTDSSGAGKALSFDLNTSSSATITDLTSGFTEDGASGKGANIDNTWDANTSGWNYAIECGDSLDGSEHLPCPGGAGGSSSDATSLSFVVDGVTISNFVENSDGYYFASSIYSSDPGSGQTTANDLTVTPEPSSALLFGTGLLALSGFLGFAWRSRSASNVTPSC